jgi:hypothetical protein
MASYKGEIGMIRGAAIRNPRDSQILKKSVQLPTLHFACTDTITRWYLQSGGTPLSLTVKTI